MLKVLLPWKYLYATYYGRSLPKRGIYFGTNVPLYLIGWISKGEKGNVWGQWRIFHGDIEHFQWEIYSMECDTVKRVDDFLRTQGYYLL